MVGLTFDDGPDPEHTPAVLDALGAFGAQATFFVLADRARCAPDLLQRIANDGHELALHGPNHDRVTHAPCARLTRSLRDARHALEDLTGTTMRWYRPPFGAQSARSYAAARAAGLDVVVWSADCRDWLPRTVNAIADEGLRNLAPGRILLLHDGLVPDPASPTPPTSISRGAMTTAILERLAGRAWSAVSVSELLTFGPVRRTAWFRP